MSHRVPLFSPYSWSTGYDWTSLPPSNYAPDNYAVFMCPVGAFVTSLALYASAYFYGNQDPMDYIGVYHSCGQHALIHIPHVVINATWLRCH